MALNFPHTSRSYEARNNQILFWGHDRMREVSFLVDIAALAKLDPPTKSSEGDWLEAFDRLLDSIQDAAQRAYAKRRHQSVYVLAVEDF